MTFYFLRIHWRFSKILKTSPKSVWSNYFSYVKVCIFWKSIQYIIHWEKNTNDREISVEQKKTVQKMSSFFFCEFKLITVLVLICGYYMTWSTIFVSLKLGVGVSILDFVSFLLKFIVLFNKMHGLFDFKTS